MSPLMTVVSTALLLSFVFCCVVSGFLQVIAWTRHARAGSAPSLRALRSPEEHFDAIGIRQILLARRLLLVGGAAYLTYGFFLLVSRFL